MPNRRRPKEKPKRRLPLLGATRCPVCFLRLRFTDEEMPDDIIAAHRRKIHDEPPVPTRPDPGLTERRPRNRNRSNRNR